MRRSLLALGASLALSCGSSNPSPDGGAHDLARAVDLMAADLSAADLAASADLAGADLAGADLAASADLATIPDLAPLPDGAVGETVAVPAGAFMMGCNAQVDTACDADESPYHMVTLSAFAIDRTEVTQAAYQVCVAAGSCTAPSASFDPVGHALYPVVSVTWAQAQTYCAFVGGHLPTEAQWEKAARGTDGRIWPWGNGAPTCTLANTLGCAGAEEPVGMHPAGASPYGALDMAGNVWEWTADYYDATYYGMSPAMDPTGPAAGTFRVYRAGSYGNDGSLARTSNRASTYSPTVGGSGLGFRCAR
jgi:formylglycine-generating enzyme required for sulfatase activity